MRTARLFAILFFIVILATTTGCGRRRPRPVGPSVGTIVQDTDKVVLIVMADVSGSYWPKLMGNPPVAFNLILKAISEMYAERLADPRDRLVISTISGSSEPIVWEGGIKDFRVSFPDAEAFKKMLVAKSKCPGSRVHSSIATTVDHVLMHRTFQAGSSMPFLLVMSDMEEGYGEDARVLEDSLRSLKKANGSVCFYWVGPAHFKHWDGFLLREFGRDRSIVTSKEDTKPILPKFK